jgi:tripartite-type tricarboxylate transporter receptor subunit TctC
VSVADIGLNATLPASYTVIAPKGLPKDVLDKLTAASLKAVQTPEFQAFTEKNGFVLDPKSSEAAATELREFSKEFAGLIEWLDKNEAGAAK